VTDPDPVAALAAQLEELRGQLARTQGEVGVLRERLEAESSQTAMLRLDVKQSRDQLAEAIEKRRLKPPSAPWWVVGADEGRAMLAGLREWVEAFLRPHYPGYMTRLPRCWANHGEAVWELSALRAEHERIYADEDNRDLQGALNWHDRLLPGVLDRLAAAIRCDEAGCRVARRPPA
jgi:regulator of replication initiation timing